MTVNLDKKLNDSLANEKAAKSNADTLKKDIAVAVAYYIQGGAYTRAWLCISG